MKKFLPILLAALIIFPAFAEAAYVSIPSFYDVTSNRIEKRIEYLGMDQNSYEGVNYTHWKYRVVDGNTGKYLERYLKKLNRKHTLELIHQDSNNWYFVYKGGQAKYLKMLGGAFHIHVGASGNDVVVDMVAGIYPE